MIRLNGEDQTSGSASAKQKEERAFLHKRHVYYILHIDSCLICIFTACYIRSLVQQVSKKLSVLHVKADLLCDTSYSIYIYIFCFLNRKTMKEVINVTACLNFALACMRIISTCEDFWDVGCYHCRLYFTSGHLLLLIEFSARSVVI